MSAKQKKTVDLKTQLKMYEDDDLEGLEDVLTPSNISKLSDVVAKQPTDKDSDGNNSSSNNNEKNKNEEDSDLEAHTDDQPEAEGNDDEVTIISGATQDESENDNILTKDVRRYITDLTKDFVKTKDKMSILKKQKDELAKEQKPREAKLLEYIQKYELKDITYGSHQLVPELVKGKKKGYNRKKMTHNLKEFLSTLDITDEVEELALQATEWLDNNRETGSDTVTLKHKVIK